MSEKMLVRMVGGCGHNRMIPVSPGNAPLHLYIADDGLDLQPCKEPELQGLTPRVKYRLCQLTSPLGSISYEYVWEGELDAKRSGCPWGRAVIQ